MRKEKSHKRKKRIGMLLHKEEDIKRFEDLRKKVQKELGVSHLSRSQFVMYMVKKMEEMG